MAIEGIKNAGLHHGKAKRTRRNRDGLAWPPDGGAAVEPGQLQGYSGGAGGKVKKSPRASNLPKGEHHVSPKE